MIAMKHGHPKTRHRHGDTGNYLKNWKLNVITSVGVGVRHGHGHIFKILRPAFFISVSFFHFNNQVIYHAEVMKNIFFLPDHNN